MEVKISFKVDVDKNDVSALLRLTHHIEELVDLDSWPEVKKIYDVRVE